MKLRIATEIIKNILISSMILYISITEIKNNINEKNDANDDYESDDLDNSFLEDD